MRKHRQEINDRALLEELLASEMICRVAMLDAGGRPYILPFNYGYREGCIYIHTAMEGKKVELLKARPEVCFEIEHGVAIQEYEKACKWSTRYRSVVGYARAELLDTEQDKQRGLEVIMAQHGAPHLVDFEPGHLRQMLILRLTITSMSGKQSSNWNA